MKKFTALFTVTLVIWFLSAIYLSLNSIINIFITTDPYISKFILASSFFLLAIMGSYNKYKKGNVLDVSNSLKQINNLKSENVKKGCKTCKQK